MTTTLKSEKLSDQLERWLTGSGEKTLGSLVKTFGERPSENVGGS
jgi:hypothetical protein